MLPAPARAQEDPAAPECDGAIAWLADWLDGLADAEGTTTVFIRCQIEIDDGTGDSNVLLVQTVTYPEGVEQDSSDTALAWAVLEELFLPFWSSLHELGSTFSETVPHQQHQRLGTLATPR